MTAALKTSEHASRERNAAIAKWSRRVRSGLQVGPHPSTAPGPLPRLRSGCYAPLLSAVAPRAARADARPRVHSWLCMAVAVLLALGFVLPPQHVLGQDTTPAGRSVIVTSPADAGPGTLRQALTDAQAGDVITFDPVVFPPSAPVTISLQSGLPAITAGPLTIDASNAGVILEGSGASYSSGLRISGADSVTIRGLQIVNFRGYGIELIRRRAECRHRWIASRGRSPSGTGQPDQRQPAGWHPHPGPGTSANRVMGNIIGADLAGTRVMANGQNGVIITVRRQR